MPDNKAEIVEIQAFYINKTWVLREAAFICCEGSIC